LLPRPQILLTLPTRRSSDLTFQQGQDVRIRGMQRRRKTKEQQSDNRRGRTECQNVGVERKVDCLAGFIIQQQDDQRALHPESKRSEEHTSELQSRVDLLCRL